MAPPTSDVPEKPAHAARTHEAIEGARPILSVVLDLRLLPAPDTSAFGDLLRGLIGAGVDVFQVRERALTDGALLEYARRVVAATRAGSDASPRVIVNRRVDVALAVGADGLHLGFDALPPAEVRAAVRRAHANPATPAGAGGAGGAGGARGEGGARGPSEPRASLRIGLSTHAADEISRAVEASADYVHLAPIYPPLSKAATRTPLGLAALADAARAPMPVIAQGGIEASNAADVIRAGAAGVAVTGHVLGADDPVASASQLRRALDSAQPTEARPPGC